MNKVAGNGTGGWTVCSAAARVNRAAGRLDREIDRVHRVVGRVGFSTAPAKMLGFG